MAIRILHCGNSIKNYNLCTFSEFLYSSEFKDLWKGQSPDSINEEPVEAFVSNPINPLPGSVMEHNYIFGLEKHLEDFLIENWEKTELGKRYELIKENGELISQQYRTDIGVIDILAREKDSNRYVVIELKKNQTSDDTVGQLARYMGWIEDKKSNGVPTKGIIIAAKYDEKLHYAMKKLSDVEVFIYKLTLSLKVTQYSPIEYQNTGEFIMIADIRNKISRQGTNLTDRLEDNLTGNFFGAIRYLPFHCGLYPILQKTKIHSPSLETQTGFPITTRREYLTDLQFWYHTDQGEIDLYFETEDTIVAIEVKYLSGLSSEDEVDNTEDSKKEYEESSNQLARYSSYLDSLKDSNNKYLIFLAPVSTGMPIIHNVLERKIIKESVHLGLLTWQDVLLTLYEIQSGLTEEWQRIIVKDLVDLLVKKGFQSFHGFLGINDTVNQHQSFQYREESIHWDSLLKVTGGVNYEYLTK